MSAQEFEEWKVYCRHEQLHPGVDRLRHAQLLAAISQGEIRRRGGKAWTAGDFMKAAPWQPPPLPSARLSAAKQIKAMSRRRK